MPWILGELVWRVVALPLSECALVSCFNLWVNDQLVPQSMKRAYGIMFEAQKRDPFRYALVTPPRTLQNGETQIFYVYGFDVERKTLNGVYLHPDALIRREYLPEEMSRDELAEKLAALPPGMPGATATASAIATR